MERQSESLSKKPWEELTQKEQQVIRKSWKHHLPDVFDVFCIGDLRIDDLCTEFPGNLYVSGDANIRAVDVAGDFIVEGNADTEGVYVNGDFIVYGNVYTGDVHVGGDFIVHGDADTFSVNVWGLFDCNDVDANEYHIYAADFVCHCYEEKNA